MCSHITDHDVWSRQISMNYVSIMHSSNLHTNFFRPYQTGLRILYNRKKKRRKLWIMGLNLRNKVPFLYVSYPFKVTRQTVLNCCSIIVAEFQSTSYRKWCWTHSMFLDSLSWFYEITYHHVVMLSKRLLSCFLQHAPYINDYSTDRPNIYCSRKI
jgi:hypothetical protein